MSYEIYRYIFLGGAIIAGIMFIVTVILFIALKIPMIIGDLTGINARKAIENIRLYNENTGDKIYRTSTVNRERGKLTDKISPSGRIVKNPTGSMHGAMETEKIGTQQLQNYESGSETTLLADDFSLPQAETTVLTGTGEFVNETTVLEEYIVGNSFVIEYEITYIHTDEIIV